MSPSSPPDTEAALTELITTYHELNSSSADIHHGPPTPIQFLRYVHANRPVVFKGAATKDHFEPAKWDTKYLLDKMAGCDVTIAETLLGNADSATINEADRKTYFVKPHETNMPFDKFIRYLQSQVSDDETEETSPVMYSQSQDDNIHKEYLPLLKDVENGLPWAADALEKEPDATNVWVGDERSVTAMHKDSYENLYCQIMGKKIFTLISPLEVMCVKERSLPSATYRPVEGSPGEYDIVPDDPPTEVHCWPTVDPEIGVRGDKWWALCKPIYVELDPGDVLYLPAMWYHKVAQETGDEGLCVAVNYWYDMEYSGPFYPAMSFIRSISQVQSALDAEKKDEEKEEKGKTTGKQQKLPFVIGSTMAYV